MKHVKKTALGIVGTDVNGKKFVMPTAGLLSHHFNKNFENRLGSDKSGANYYSILRRIIPLHFLKRFDIEPIELDSTLPEIEQIISKHFSKNFIKKMAALNEAKHKRLIEENYMEIITSLAKCMVPDQTRQNLIQNIQNLLASLYYITTIIPQIAIETGASKKYAEKIREEKKNDSINIDSYLKYKIFSFHRNNDVQSNIPKNIYPEVIEMNLLMNIWSTINKRIDPDTQVYFHQDNHDLLIGVSEFMVKKIKDAKNKIEIKTNNSLNHVTTTMQARAVNELLYHFEKTGEGSPEFIQYLKMLKRSFKYIFEYDKKEITAKDLKATNELVRESQYRLFQSWRIPAGKSLNLKNT